MGLASTPDLTIERLADRLRRAATESQTTKVRKRSENRKGESPLAPLKTAPNREKGLRTKNCGRRQQHPLTRPPISRLTRKISPNPYFFISVLLRGKQALGLNGLFRTGPYRKAISARLAIFPNITNQQSLNIENTFSIDEDSQSPRPIKAKVFCHCSCGFTRITPLFVLGADCSQVAPFKRCSRKHPLLRTENNRLRRRPQTMEGLGR